MVFKVYYKSLHFVKPYAACFSKNYINFLNISRKLLQSKRFIWYIKCRDANLVQAERSQPFHHLGKYGRFSPERSLPSSGSSMARMGVRIFPDRSFTFRSTLYFYISYSTLCGYPIKITHSLCNHFHLLQNQWLHNAKRLSQIPPAQRARRQHLPEGLFGRPGIPM